MIKSSYQPFIGLYFSIKIFGVGYIGRMCFRYDILWDSSSSSISNIFELQQEKENHWCIRKPFFKILRKSVFEETQNLRKHFPIILNSMHECKTMIYFFYIENLKRNFFVFKYVKFLSSPIYSFNYLKAIDDSIAFLIFEIK